MKRLIIGSIVGAILVFGWQAVAHMFMHHHDAGYKTAPNSQAILSALAANMKEEGQYMLPDMKMDATQEEMDAMDKAMQGKPWAVITYHPSWKNDMGTAILRGFATALLCVAIFIGILGKIPGSFSSIFLKSLGLGFLIFMFVWYNQNIWMQTPWNVVQGELIDLLAAWGLCGLWLGWWLNRRVKRV